MEEKDPIKEALRYVANAEEIIKKAKYDPELKSYTDSKYIKTAGNVLWSGCLIALDAVLQVRKGKGRPSIQKYQDAAGKRDKKLLHFLNIGYDTMHLCMGYMMVTKTKESPMRASTTQKPSLTTVPSCCHSQCVRKVCGLLVFASDRVTAIWTT